MYRVTNCVPQRWGYTGEHVGYVGYMVWVRLSFCWAERQAGEASLMPYCARLAKQMMNADERKDGRFGSKDYVLRFESMLAVCLRLSNTASLTAMA